MESFDSCYLLKYQECESLQDDVRCGDDLVLANQCTFRIVIPNPFTIIIGNLGLELGLSSFFYYVFNMGNYSDV